MAAKKKKTATKPYGNKTKFVLGLSRDLSAKQVVDEAKKNGITITEAHVYKIRSTAKTKGKATKAAKGRRATQSAAGSGQSKREFVLGFGADTPASEILRKAKEAGIGLSKAYLYTIRSSGGATKGRGARTVVEAKSVLKRVRGAAASLESQFVEAALDLGFAKATELLNRLRTRAKSY